MPRWLSVSDKHCGLHYGRFWPESGHGFFTSGSRCNFSNTGIRLHKVFPFMMVTVSGLDVNKILEFLPWLGQETWKTTWWTPTNCSLLSSMTCAGDWEGQGPVSLFYLTALTSFLFHSGMFNEKLSNSEENEQCITDNQRLSIWAIGPIM